MSASRIFFKIKRISDNILFIKVVISLHFVFVNVVVVVFVIPTPLFSFYYDIYICSTYLEKIVQEPKKKVRLN